MKLFDTLQARSSPPARPIGAFDAQAITDTIRRALSSAGLDTDAGPMKGVTETIQRALSSAGLGGASMRFDRAGETIDVVAREVRTGTATALLPPLVEPVLPRTDAKPAGPGEFVTRSFTNQAGTRTYKLYVPASYAAHAGERVPLVVMLHGCTQSPDDFAAGTRMNELAEQRGFLVVYPGQAPNANQSRCWNWFKAEDQARDVGEPSLIAGITREVIAAYCVDPRRVFVAGLSAGAAMAVILGQTYPELFAAVGAHSGLPYGAAHDMPSAFAAMHGAPPIAGMSDLPGMAKPARRATPFQSVPTIVFHGDQDRTVNARNGAEIVEQATGATPAGGPDQSGGLRKSVQQAAAGGRSYERTVFADSASRPVVEQWVLHGAGHAWSGGSASGSFTDASGPDASAEMVRFFYAQQRAGTA